MVTGEIAPSGNIRGGAGVLGDEEQDLARLHGLETQAELQHQLAAGHVSSIPGVVRVGGCIYRRRCRVSLKS